LQLTGSNLTAVAHLLFPWSNGERTLSKKQPLYGVLGTQSDLLMFSFNYVRGMRGVGVGACTGVWCRYTSMPYA